MHDDAAGQLADRKQKVSLSVIDRAPMDPGELADYFRSLTPRRLASCWVACLVDIAFLNDGEAGAVARACNVVAERLHGVQFPEPPVGEHPLTIPAESPFSKQATKLREANAIRAGTAAGATAPSAPPPVAPGPRTVGKFEIFTGPPPAEKPRHQRADTTEVIAAAIALPVGGWFIWKEAKKTLNCVKFTAKLVEACGFDVICYRTVPGTVVIKRPVPRVEEGAE